MSRFATMAIFLAGLLLSAGRMSGVGNNNASRESGPNIDETTGKEIPPVNNFQ